MMEPLFTEAEAEARAVELVAAFDRYCDVLSPDEQALAMAIRRRNARQQLEAITLGPILVELQAASDAVDEEAERNSINTPEHTRRLCEVGLIARHFLRERTALLNGTDPWA